MRTKKNKIIQHHRIGFETMEKIDWHFQNVHSAGWKTIVDISEKQHKRIHFNKGKTIYKGNLKIWMPDQTK